MDGTTTTTAGEETLSITGPEGTTRGKVAGVTPRHQEEIITKGHRTGHHLRTGSLHRPGILASGLVCHRPLRQPVFMEVISTVTTMGRITDRGMVITTGGRHRHREGIMVGNNIIANRQAEEGRITGPMEGTGEVTVGLEDIDRARLPIIH